MRDRRRRQIKVGQERRKKPYKYKMRDEEACRQLGVEQDVFKRMIDRGDYNGEEREREM